MNKFKPKRGQIDYTNARWAPVVNCVLRYRGRILIVKRNRKMRFYPGLWNGIGGFLDDNKDIKDKVKEELREEADILPRDIISMRIGEIFDIDEPKYKKTWIIHPVLVDVRTDKVKFDWEAEDSKWVSVNDARRYKLLPSFNNVLKKLFGKTAKLRKL